VQNRLLLVSRVHELQGRLAKDSHNISKQPSSDGLKRKTKSLRQRSGRSRADSWGIAARRCAWWRDRVPSRQAAS
jgi:hypothetical protein